MRKKVKILSIDGGGLRGIVLFPYKFINLYRKSLRIDINNKLGYFWFIW
jgi:patatin-like phospholipase/acyl hydrolase